MTDSSTAEATGGLTVAEAAEAFMAMDPDEGHSGDETQDEESTEPEDEPEEQSEGAEGEEQSDDDEEDDAEGSEQPDDQPVKLTLDGKEVEVTLHELKRSFLREADYTRKTQALAEERKSLDTDRQGLSQQREQAKVILDHWEQQLSTPLYDPAETEALRFTDPAEWAARKQEEADRIGQLQGITARKTQLTSAEIAEQKAAHQRAVVDAEQKLFEAIPEWKADPATAKKGLEEIWKYAGTHGFTPQDILADPDHRALLILRDAAAYQAIKARRPQVEKKVEAVKIAKPGSALTPNSKVSELTRAKQRLAKTHSVDDAARIFMLREPPK